MYVVETRPVQKQNPVFKVFPLSCGTGWAELLCCQFPVPSIKSICSPENWRFGFGPRPASYQLSHISQKRTRRTRPNGRGRSGILNVSGILFCSHFSGILPGIRGFSVDVVTLFVEKTLGLKRATDALQFSENVEDFTGRRAVMF